MAEISHYAKLPNLINIENGHCMNYRSLITLTLCFILPLSLTQQSALADGVSSGIKAPILGARSSEAAILGVRDNAKGGPLYIKPATLDTQWHVLPKTQSVIDAIILPGGKRILGVGKDQELYTRETLDSDWVHVPNSGRVIAVTIMQDGTLLGVGADNSLFTKKELEADWIKVPNSRAVNDVAILPDGKILGVGVDYWLYTRDTLNSDWVKVPSSNAVSRAIVMNNGSLRAYGRDGWTWTRATLDDPWEKDLNSVSGVNSTIVWDDSPLTRIKVENTTGARFRFVAYRQDGIRVDNGIFETNSSEIIAEPGKTVDITFNSSGLGWFILTAFVAPGAGETPSNPPAKLGISSVTVGVGGGGGSGFTVLGIGGSASGSASITKPEYFATPLAIAGMFSGSYKLVGETTFTFEEQNY
jgi:hypothetical protein